MFVGCQGVSWRNARHISSCSLNRRQFVDGLLSVSTLAGLDSEEPQVAVAHRIIQQQCQPYLAKFSSAGRVSWLYRGEEIVGDLQTIAPEPDLLSPDTYSGDGFLFFYRLRRLVNSSSRNSLDLASAHIAATNASEAALWGTPVVVVPIGEFRSVHFSSGSTFFDEGHDRRLVPSKQFTEDLRASKGEIIFDSVDLSSPPSEVALVVPSKRFLAMRMSLAHRLEERLWA